MHDETVKEAFVKKYYDGDVEEFERERASVKLDPDYDSSAYAKRETTNWSDIEQQIKSHPEHEQLVLNWTRRRLGYLPEQHAYMPYLAYMQTLIESYETKAMPDEEFFPELLLQAKNIRNEDMKSSGWLSENLHDSAAQAEYDTYLAIHKQAARERLTRFLGHAPALEYSLKVELHLRQVFTYDSFHSGMPFCDFDYQAATITAYREIFLTQGEAAANASAFVEPAIAD